MMDRLRQLDQQLMDAAVAQRRRDKLLRDEQQLVAQLTDARAKLREWEQTVAKTSKTLVNLDQASLSYVFSTLFGDRQDRIADEQERLLKQKLQRDECAAAVTPLEGELQAMRSELVQLADVAARRDALLLAKEEVLQSRGDAIATELVASGQRLADMVAMDREIAEAIEAGKAVLAHLEATMVDLRGARSWGHFDLLGGGLISGLAKHGSLNNAREHVHQAQVSLRRFLRELRDVDALIPDFDISIDGLATFVDIFFDGLIVDWFVQSRIATAIRRVEEADYKVRSMTHELWLCGCRHVEEMQQLHAQRQAWLEGLQ